MTDSSEINNTILEDLYNHCIGLKPGTHIAEESFLFNRYKSDALLGRGGTSIVISAFDNQLRRKVAIKIFNPEIGYEILRSNDKKLSNLLNPISFFKKEAQILASLDHPNLCKVYDFGVSKNGIPWLILEFFDGITLREIMNGWKTNQNLHSIENVYVIINKLIEVTDYLHRKGFIQLDIKPENILVNQQYIKLIDIASCFERSNKKMVRFGTPGYIAPEILTARSDDSITPASDIFSIGVVFFELCCLFNPLITPQLKTKILENFSGLKNIYPNFISCTICRTTLPPSRNSSVPPEDRVHPDSSVLPDRLGVWEDLYISSLEKLNIEKYLLNAPIDIPIPIIILIERMLSISSENRPQDLGEVSREVQLVRKNAFPSKKIFEITPGNMIKEIKILFLTAEPSNITRMRPGNECREIQERLRIAQLRQNFKLVERFSIRPEDISQALLDEKPMIVHFSGYGSIEGNLFFEDKTGGAKIINPEALASLFDLVKDQTKCVILNANYSKKQAKIISESIEYVIGMPSKISFNHSISFSIGFYQALGAGKSFNEGYLFGCAQMRMQGVGQEQLPEIFTKKFE